MFSSVPRPSTGRLLLCGGLFVLMGPPLILARAGGGGGGGGGTGGWVSAILLPIAVIYAAIVSYQVGKKNRQCEDLLGKLQKLDQSWNLDTLKSRISEVYFKVQQAWMERDQNIAKDCMSDALFERHKQQTDLMISGHRKNMLENIRLLETDIVDVEAFIDTRKDLFWVYLKGSMVDYIINDQNNSNVSGDRARHEFVELWKFIRCDNRWVLDEIDEKGVLRHLKQFRAETESS